MQMHSASGITAIRTADQDDLRLRHPGRGARNNADHPGCRPAATKRSRPRGPADDHIDHLINTDAETGEEPGNSHSYGIDDLMFYQKDTNALRRSSAKS
jgi:hypothetical protein